MAAKDLVGPAFVGSDTSSFIVTRGITAPGTPYNSRFVPGGCDKCCCIVFSDNFNRADDTDVNASTGYGNWDEVAGNWAVVSNKVRIAATASAILKCRVVKSASNGGRDRIYIQFTATASASGDKVRAIASYVDADNYWFGEVACGGSTTVIGQRVAGVETIYQSNAGALAVGTPNTFIMCVDQANGLLYFRNVTGGGDAACAATLNGSGYFAFGTGGTCTGNVDFDTLRVSRVATDYRGVMSPGYSHSAAANIALGYGWGVDFGVTGGVGTVCQLCTRNCSSCIPGSFPSSVQVVIAGLTNGTCFDGMCTTLNGTYVLPLHVNGTGTPLLLNAGGAAGAVGSCLYELAISPEVCNSAFGKITTIRLNVPAGGARAAFNVNIGKESAIAVQWVYSAGGEGPGDCRWADAIATVNFNDGRCLATGATATVTAL